MAVLREMFDQSFLRSSLFIDVLSLHDSRSISMNAMDELYGGRMDSPSIHVTSTYYLCISPINPDPMISAHILLTTRPARFFGGPQSPFFSKTPCLKYLNNLEVEFTKTFRYIIIFIKDTTA